MAQCSALSSLDDTFVCPHVDIPVYSRGRSYLFVDSFALEALTVRSHIEACCSLSACVYDRVCFVAAITPQCMRIPYGAYELGGRQTALTGRGRYEYTIIYIHNIRIYMFYRNHNKQEISQGSLLPINKHNNNNKHSVSLNNRGMLNTSLCVVYSICGGCTMYTLACI